MGVGRGYHPDILTDELKHGRCRGKQSYPRKPERIGKTCRRLNQVGLHGLIFFQRPMYWPKSVVGQCELEPKKRCPAPIVPGSAFACCWRLTTCGFSPVTERSRILLRFKESLFSSCCDAKRKCLLTRFAKH